MPEYYFEYCVPNIEEYDPETARKNKTNPEYYQVTLSDVAYAQNEKIADLQIKDIIEDVYPLFSDGFGVMMFTELPENETEESFSFSDSDWKERLEREVTNPSNTITFEK